MGKEGNLFGFLGGEAFGCCCDIEIESSARYTESVPNWIVYTGG